MKLGIMQPYFLPYFGYFQLIHSVDKFVLYDNLKFTKKGWITRNKIINNNGNEYLFSLSLKSDSDMTEIRNRFLSENWIEKERFKFLQKVNNFYRKAPNFTETYSLLEEIILSPETNLFEFLYHSIAKVAQKLEIKTEIIKSSLIQDTEKYKNKDKVLHICKSLGATEYINPPGGKLLYNSTEFKEKEINLLFLVPNLFEYKQSYQQEFIKGCSIIDVMMNNKINEITRQLNIMHFD